MEQWWHWCASWTTYTHIIDRKAVNTLVGCQLWRTYQISLQITSSDLVRIYLTSYNKYTYRNIIRK